MEIFCGKCLVDMLPLKKKETTQQKWSSVVQKKSMKCPQCGHVVIATWNTELVVNREIVD